MSDNDMLVQDEIDALLHSVSGDEDASSDPGKQNERRIRPFDPKGQHRIIRDRLHALDIINARFARLFRIGLFNLIRRTPDITLDGVEYKSFSSFSRNVPVPANINVVSMKPLRGSALVMFPPNLVFMVVDNLFGGDGRFLTKSEGRDFTNTEQRIITRLLNLATDAYQEAWQSIFPLEISYLRSEMQARFANITNSPNEIVVNTTFNLEVGNLVSNFQICMPYAMIEPIKDILGNPMTENDNKEDADWQRRMAGEIRQSNVELIADFVGIDARVRDVVSLKPGDILPFDLPKEITARVDNVPVLKAGFGSHHGHHALRVSSILDHSINDFKRRGSIRPERNGKGEESDHD